MSKINYDINLLNQTINQWKGAQKNDELDDIWPLCDEYMEDNCKQCPIAQTTGKPLCRTTPYKDFTLHMALEHSEIEPAIRCNKCKHFANSMVQFLENILIKLNSQAHMLKK